MRPIYSSNSFRVAFRFLLRRETVRLSLACSLVVSLVAPPVIFAAGPGRAGMAEAALKVEGPERGQSLERHQQICPTWMRSAHAAILSHTRRRRFIPPCARGAIRWRRATGARLVILCRQQVRALQTPP